MTNKTIINDLMEELLTHKNCVFRGENKDYRKVSSKLYRQYFKNKSVINSENFSVLTIEKDIVDKAKRHISSTASNIEVLTELQHYGGKTALIDFTHNVLIALFFACRGELKKDGRIIIFDQFKAAPKTDIDYKNKDIYQIISPTGKSPRVIFQSSVFIQAQQGYLDEKDYKSITIKKEQKQDLLDYLQEYFHIEEATIYNDIHGFIKNQDNYPTAELEFYKGLAYDNNQDFKEAIKHYDKSIELAPKHPEAYNNRGIAKDDLGQHKEAIKDYDQAIALNPQFVQAYSNRGIAKSNLREYQEAIKDCDQAIAFNPEYAEAYYNRGIAKADLGEHKEAIKDYDQAIKLSPQFAEAYGNRGSAKDYLEQYQEAIADYNQAKTLFEQQGKTESVVKVEQALKIIKKKLKNDKKTNRKRQQHKNY